MPGARRSVAATVRGGLVACLASLLAAGAASAQLAVPPGFSVEVHVTGQGFDAAGERGSGQGIPAIGTIGLDATGALYLARTGARFRSGEVEELWPLYRIGPDGARLSPRTEPQFLHGPPLLNPQVGAVSPDGTLWVTTYDRDRRLGALYRMAGGRPVLFAGGRPEPGEEPLLRHPEGVAVDAAGHVYVADRERHVVVRLDPAGRLLDRAHARITRPRMLALDATGHLWVGADGSAETPFGAGLGEFWRVAPDGTARLVLRGPLPAGIAPGPRGTLFVAQRRTGQVFVLTPDGRRLEFGAAPRGSFVRALAFGPDGPGARRAGVAGALFVVVVPRSLWLVNEVVRVAGPLEDWLDERLASPAETP